MAIVTEPGSSAGIPNSKTTVSESTPAIPTSKTTVSEAGAAIPTSKTTVAEVTPAIPVSKTTVAEVSAGIPAAKTTVSEAAPAIPVSKTTIGAAGVPRSLIPLVDMHFDSEVFNQRGNTVLFDDLFTYARNSSATFINRRIVNNKAEFFLDTDFVGTVDNEFLRSEQFNDPDWAKSASVVLPDITKSPINDLTADKLQADSTATITPVTTQSVTSIAAQQYTISINVKKSEASFFQIHFNVSNVTGDPRVNFDVNLGVIGSIDSEITASIRDSGNGFFEVSATVVAAGTSLAVRFGLMKSISDTRGFANSWTAGEGLFIWGAQFTNSAKLQPYVSTLGFGTGIKVFTETLRVEYDPVTGENLGALIEGASTNLFVRNEEFNVSSWTKTRTTITSNSKLAPDLTTSADRLQEDATASNTHFVSDAVTVANNAVVTVSIFAKADDRNELRIFDNAGSGSGQFFNLQGGTLGTSTGAIIDSSIDFIRDNWYRCVMTFTASGTAANIHFRLVESSTDTYNGDGSSGLFIWGAQVEQRPIATSYIRTEGATVARAADDLTAPNAGSMPNGGDFSYMVDFDILGNQDSFVSIDQRLILTSDSDASLFQSVLSFASPKYVSFYGGTARDFNLNSENLTSAKFSMTFDQSTNLINTFVDGIPAFSGDAGVSFVLDVSGEMHVGSSTSGTQQLFGHIKKLTTYQEKLTAQEVALL